MTALTAMCARCAGKGWLQPPAGFPYECPDCTPTKLRAGRIVIDGTRVSAILEKRKATERTDNLHAARPNLFNRA